MPPEATLGPDCFGSSTPPPAAAMGELRQNRSADASAGTTMFGNCPWQHWAVKMVPVSAFSGRPPSAGGLKRGSRHVPVHIDPPAGSILSFAWVSLLETSVRDCVPGPAA